MDVKKKDNLTVEITYEDDNGETITEAVPKAEILTGLQFASDAFDKADAHYNFRKELAKKALKLKIDFSSEEKEKLSEMVK